MAPVPTTKSFREFHGTCGVLYQHPKPDSTYPYAKDPDRVIQMILDSGYNRIRSDVRDAYLTSSPSPGALAAAKEYRDRLFRLRDAGFSFSFMVAGPYTTAGDNEVRRQQVQWVSQNFDHSRICFETINEPDIFLGRNQGLTNWPTITAQHMKNLRDQRDRYCPEVPILGPSYGTMNTPTESSQKVRDAWVALGYGDPSIAYTYNNAHPYPGTGISGLDHLKKEAARHVFGVIPMAATEWNWATYGNGVPEDVQATYIIRNIASHWLGGWKLTTIYDFIDLNTADRVNSSNNFGVVHSDFTTKPAYAAMQMMNFILGPRQDPATRLALNYTVTSSDPLTRHFALQASNGRFIIMIWREQALWNFSTKTRISVPPIGVQVTAPAGQWQVVYPSSGTVPPAFTSSGTAGVLVGGELTMVVV